MNKKNKVLLTSVGLAMLSGIAATGSTFAWFTTTRTASVSYSSATVTTNQSSLAISFVESKNSVTNSTTAGGISISGGNEITDVSSDGILFLKPTWAGTPGVASNILDVTADSATTNTEADGYYIDFTVNLVATGNTPVNVYLGTGTGLSSGNTAALAAARMAVVVDGAVKMIYATDADHYTDVASPVATNGHRYLNAASATDQVVSGVGVTAPKTTYAGPLYTSFTTYNTVAAATIGTTLVALLEPTTAAADDIDVTFRIWLEGEDVDAVVSAVTGVINSTINFYALDAA